MSAPRHDERERKSHGVALVIAIFVILLLPCLYGFSIGPAALLVSNEVIDNKRAEAFYFPIVWLHDNTPLAPVIEWYIMLWGGG